jgi:hypothetical protein
MSLSMRATSHSTCELSKPLLPMERRTSETCPAMLPCHRACGPGRRLCQGNIVGRGFQAGPVFELQVTASRPCPTAAYPQLACFAVEMRNVGEKTGEGRCVVHHYARDGEALVGEGPSFEARLRPGEVMRAQGQAHLTAPITALRFNSSYCNPGPRL